MDNSLEPDLMISKKSLFFKAFSGMDFERKMKVIHKWLAEVFKVVHNILCPGGQKNTRATIFRGFSVIFAGRFVKLCSKFILYDKNLLHK